MEQHAQTSQLAGDWSVGSELRHGVILGDTSVVPPRVISCSFSLWKMIEEHQEAGTQAQKQRRKRKRGGKNSHLGKDQRDDQKRERERNGKNG